MNILTKLKQIDALERGATPGEWFVNGENACYGIQGEPHETFHLEDACEWELNNALICKTRNAYPEMSEFIKEAIQLLKENDDQNAVQDFLKKHSLTEKGDE